MPTNRVIISRRASATIIAAEIALTILVTWIYAGMPGLSRDTGPATVTVQFGPLISPRPLSRSHEI